MLVHQRPFKIGLQSGLSLRAVTRNTCYGKADMTVTGVDVFWCCIGATLNFHMCCIATGENYYVMAAQKFNDSTATVTQLLYYQYPFMLYSG